MSARGDRPFLDRVEHRAARLAPMAAIAKSAARARGNLDLDSTIDCVSELMDGIERSRKRPTLAPEYGLTEDIDGCGFLAPGADVGCFGA